MFTGHSVQRFWRYAAARPEPYRTLSRKPLGDGFESRSRFYYILATGIAMLGVGYAGVPLYRLFCAKSGYGMNTEFARVKTELVRNMLPVKSRQIKVHFSADTHSKMAWRFQPLQECLTVVPGETALAFYSAENPTNNPIVGIATYSVVPVEAAKYFNKIQVDMPVFFFLDPQFADDPQLQRVDHIVLHYTFFEARENKLTIPGVTSPNSNVSLGTL